MFLPFGCCLVAALFQGHVSTWKVPSRCRLWCWLQVSPGAQWSVADGNRDKPRTFHLRAPVDISTWWSQPTTWRMNASIDINRLVGGVFWFQKHFGWWKTQASSKSFDTKVNNFSLPWVSRSCDMLRLPGPLHWGHSSFVEQRAQSRAVLGGHFWHERCKQLFMPAESTGGGCNCSPFWPDA